MVEEFLEIVKTNEPIRSAILAACEEFDNESDFIDTEKRNEFFMLLGIIFMILKKENLIKINKTEEHVSFDAKKSSSIVEKINKNKKIQSSLSHTIKTEMPEDISQVKLHLAATFMLGMMINRNVVKICV